MNILIFLVPAIFSFIMLINGAMRYWGNFDKESTEAIFYHYIPSERESKNWKLSQKIYGKNLLVAGLLNIVTEVALIPAGILLIDVAGKTNTTSFGMLLFMFLPSAVYLFGARLMMELKLKRLEEYEERNRQR